MKKTITIIISIFAIMCLSNNVFAAAATWTQASAGAQLTVGSTGAASDFVYNPSPGVIIEGASDITVYCILTGNAKAAANAIAYCVASNSGQVAQQSVDLTTATDLGTPTADGTIVSGFVTK